MKNNNDLFFIYLNEFNYKFLSSGAKKFNCKNILRLLKKNKTQTYTEDKIQDKNLDPWVQNISINTGVKSLEHKTFKLGENAPKKYIQIWDLLVRNKITSMVWGPMNASYLKNKNLKLFFPDPWNFKNNTYPESLKYLNDLPNYYARNYLDIKIYKIIKYSFLFTLGIFINKSFFSTIKNSFFYLKIFLKRNLKNYILFFILDIISINILKKKIFEQKPSFAYIFLNSLAHFQHNNWDEKDKLKDYFLFSEIICKELIEIEKKYNSTIIINGFTQKKIKSEYILRPKNPEKFLKTLKVNFKDLKQNMTNGGLIFFKNRFEQIKAEKILRNFEIFGFKVFEVNIQKKNCLFYRIKIISYSILNKKNIHKINKLNVGKFLCYDSNKKLQKFIKYNEKIDFFINNIHFIKTTGKHSNNGDLFYKNIALEKSILNKKQIENHKIYNIIKRHFLK